LGWGIKSEQLAPIGLFVQLVMMSLFITLIALEKARIWIGFIVLLIFSSRKRYSLHGYSYTQMLYQNTRSIDKEMHMMTKWISILIILSLGFMFMNNRQNEGYRAITPTEAKAKLKDKKVILLDVRTTEEYREKHIQGSVLIPVNELQGKIEEVVPNKDQEIIIYCRSGNRSETASKILLKRGYKNVYDLGGIINWTYEVE
jgi:rhodanese-related sulfurtransferase